MQKLTLVILHLAIATFVIVPMFSVLFVLKSFKFVWYLFRNKSNDLLNNFDEDRTSTVSL